MFRRLSGSVCSVLLWTCLTACPGSDSGNTGGSPAAGSGGDSAQDPDAGSVYEGDAGPAAGSGGAGGKAGGNSGGKGGSDSWSPAKDVKPAECRPDPTDFSPCGGDVTGKWRVAALCFPSSLEQLQEELMCPEIKQESSYDYRMLVDFKSSGNFTVAVKADAVQSVTIPKDCLTDEELGCSVLGEDDTDDSDGDTLTITSDATSCFIEAQIHDVDSAAGTWEVSGTEITMTDSSGPDTSEYCITDNTLVVRSENEITGTVSWGVFERL